MLVKNNLPKCHWMYLQLWNYEVRLGIVLGVLLLLALAILVLIGVFV